MPQILIPISKINEYTKGNYQERETDENQYKSSNGNTRIASVVKLKTFINILFNLIHYILNFIILITTIYCVCLEIKCRKA